MRALMVASSCVSIGALVVLDRFLLSVSQEPDSVGFVAVLSVVVVGLTGAHYLRGVVPRASVVVVRPVVEGCGDGLVSGVLDGVLGGEVGEGRSSGFGLVGTTGGDGVPGMA